MFDRDARVVFGAFLAFVLLLAGSLVVENLYGPSLLEYPILSLLVFAGLAVVAPQLYLAATDETVPPRSRVQFAAIATAAFATAFAGTTDGAQYLVLATIGAAAIFALVCYELLVEYRASSDGRATRTP